MIGKQTYIINMQGISVIMPSYLGPYPGSRHNPEDKFIRAVNSFQDQTHHNKELVIISDGCTITNGLYQAYFKQDPNITLIQCEKRKDIWPGELREVGRSIAKYDWITYLDSDDVILENHLKIISNKIEELSESERLIFNTRYLVPLIENPNELYFKMMKMNSYEFSNFLNSAKYIEFKNFKLVYGQSWDHIGTWQITHHKHIPVRWMNSNKIGEDAYFIERCKKVERWKEFVGQYLICHHVNLEGQVVCDI